MNATFYFQVYQWHVKKCAGFKSIELKSVCDVGECVCDWVEQTSVWTKLLIDSEVKKKTKAGENFSHANDGWLQFMYF